MATPIVLASRLPGHAELDGDLRPSDAEADGVIDQRHELRLCLSLRNPDAPDPLQHFGGVQTRSLLRLAGRFRWR